MSELKIFESEQFGAIRTMVDNEKGEVLFCLGDVCKALGLQPSRVKDRLIDGVITRNPIFDRLGRKQMANFVNEGGLYDVIFESRKPEAKAFRTWVCCEVLPKVRRTGGYIRINREMSDMEVLSRAMRIAQETIEERDQLIADQERLLNEERPLLNFAHAVCESEDCITVAELAKLMYDNGINVGQNRLFVILRQSGYLGTTPHHWNVAQQRWIEHGLFKLKNSEPWFDEQGRPHYCVKTMVTGKGQRYFLEMFGGTNLHQC